ncbi:MAG: transglutaminase domain-containing protein [Flavobacteriaceae bacterium]|nr:transglutaminase domain-containing protein [Flavobacteriaceae bacterium]
MRTFYRLAGVDYKIIQNCNSDTKTKYLNLSFSILLTTLFAFIGGVDIALQFDLHILASIVVGLLWATAVFSFDYFLINGGHVSSFFKWVRVPVGFANIFITITALLILLNKATINSTIGLQNADKISTLDSTYLSNKENRYDLLNGKKVKIEEYHQESCIPEAMDVLPGPKYRIRHSLCETTTKNLEKETSNLDSLETSYFNSYQHNRAALVQIKSNDFFAKAKMLPDIFKANNFVLILALCAFIFLGYIELQSIMLKFSMNENDDYNISRARYDENRKEFTASLIDNIILKERKNEELMQFSEELDVKNKFFDLQLRNIQATILKEYQLKSMLKILASKGYENSTQVIKEIDFNPAFEIKNNETSKSDDLFKMTNPMLAIVNKIRKKSDKESLPKNLFSWILNNIKYDDSHSREFYRTAAETYNNKLGVCGELSVLLMAFYRSAGIDCNFVKVTKDYIGKEVSHACLSIKSNSEIQLIDLAYKNFDIKHTEFTLLTEVELINSYKNWNQ